MNYRKITLSASVIAFVSALVFGGTQAFFSDEETSAGNFFTAGAIDLQIDNSSYGFDYNDPNAQEPSGEWGPNEANSWELDDLTDQLFFSFGDLKPGDYGEDTISIHVDNNDAWACMAFDLTGTPENGQNEPEAEADSTDGDDEGELQNYLSFLFWWDDGDNVLEDDEQVLENLSGLPGDVFTGSQLAIADSNTGEPLPGGETLYLGKGWCFGEITPDPVDQDDSGDNPPSAPDRIGFTCDGSGDHNDAQTDGIEVDVSFYAEQSRNNPDFVCSEGDDGLCSEEVDVMLVLDSSSSIGGDLTTLQDAAKAFVTALGPSTDGAHVGVVDFDADGTLEQGLTDDTTLINNAIDALVSDGTTNLEEGIRVAQAEFANGRPGAPDIMVIITDGEPTAQDGNLDADGTNAGEAEDAADDAKGAGTEIFAVGVGGGVDATYLENSIVSSPSGDHYFDSAEFADLEQILIDLTDCPNGDDQRDAVGAAAVAYSAPSCDATVSGDQSIQAAVDAAAENATVCVDDTYTGVGDDVAIRIETLGLTLASTPQGVALDVPVVLSNSNVTVTGFEGSIGQAESPAEVAAFYVDGDADNFEISHNTVNGGSGAAILTETGGANGGGLIANNVLTGATQGIYLNPHTGTIVIEYNDIDNNAAGIAGLNGATVRHNEFEHTTPGSEAVGVDESFDDNPATFNFNNVLDDMRMNTYDTPLAGTLAGTVDAENNFWGPNGGAAQTDDSGGGSIDFDPEEGSAFPHN